MGKQLEMPRQEAQERAVYNGDNTETLLDQIVANTNWQGMSIDDHGNLEVKTIGEATMLAKILLKSGLAPSHFNNVSALVVAILYLREIGVPVVRGLQFAYVVKGRVAVWGDLVLAIAQSDPDFDFERFEQKWEGKGKDLVAICRCARKGGAIMERRFSMAQAEAAGLLRNDTYKNYPEDMVMWKATHRCLKSLFSSRLMGVRMAEDLIGVGDEPPKPPSESLRLPRRKPAYAGTVESTPEPDSEPAKPDDRARLWAIAKDTMGEAEFAELVGAHKDDDGNVDWQAVEGEILAKEAALA